MEHPAADDTSPLTASVWRTFVVRTLLLFPQPEAESAAGGRAIAVKTTDLLYQNVAARTTTLPKKGVVGLDEKNRWRTAVLKDYLPMFCEVLARLCHESQMPLHELDPIALVWTR